MSDKQYILREPVSAETLGIMYSLVSRCDCRSMVTYAEVFGVPYGEGLYFVELDQEELLTKIADKIEGYESDRWQTYDTFVAHYAEQEGYGTDAKGLAMACEQLIREDKQELAKEIFSMFYPDYFSIENSKFDECSDKGLTLKATKETNNE